MNATKHGILSTQVLVRGLNIKESSEEFFALHDRFRQDLNPVGAVEEMLVDQIVTTHWRLRRVLTAESAEIALSVDEGHFTRDSFDGTLRTSAWADSEDASAAMMDSTSGCIVLQRWLDKLRDQVEREGELTEAAVNADFGSLRFYSAKLQRVRLQFSQKPTDTEPDDIREQNKIAVLDFIEREQRFLRQHETTLRERDAAREESLQAAAVLPQPPVIDKILRYETKLEKQLCRAMNQLERLQRRRQGENVPPPVVMDVERG